jgi:RNA polymerase sigma-70 factor (ECF subfamily)
MTDPRARALPLGVATGKAGPKAEPWHIGVDEARSLDALYRDHLAFVWRVVRRYGVPFEAIEDVVHDVFIVVRRRLRDLDARDDVRGWLFMITRGVIANDRRSRQRREHRERVASVEPAIVDPEQQAETAEAIELVERFLRTLSEAQRVVFELVDIEGFTVPEVARLGDAPLDTVYSRLRLARAAFARFCASIREEATT